MHSSLANAAWLFVGNTTYTKSHSDVHSSVAHCLKWSLGGKSGHYGTNWCNQTTIGSHVHFKHAKSIYFPYAARGWKTVEQYVFPLVWRFITALYGYIAPAGVDEDSRQFGHTAGADGEYIKISIRSGKVLSVRCVSSRSGWKGPEHLWHLAGYTYSVTNKMRPVQCLFWCNNRYSPNPLVLGVSDNPQNFNSEYFL